MSSESGAIAPSVIVTCQRLVWTCGRAVWDSDDALSRSDRDWLACSEAASAEASRADRAKTAATISVLNTRETAGWLRCVMGDFRPNRSIAHGRRSADAWLLQSRISAPGPSRPRRRARRCKARAGAALASPEGEGRGLLSIIQPAGSCCRRPASPGQGNSSALPDDRACRYATRPVARPRPTRASAHRSTARRPNRAR